MSSSSTSDIFDACFALSWRTTTVPELTWPRQRHTGAARHRAGWRRSRGGTTRGGRAAPSLRTPSRLIARFSGVQVWTHVCTAARPETWSERVERSVVEDGTAIGLNARLWWPPRPSLRPYCLPAGFWRRTLAGPPVYRQLAREDVRLGGAGIRRGVPHAKDVGGGFRDRDVRNALASPTTSPWPSTLSSRSRPSRRRLVVW